MKYLVPSIGIAMLSLWCASWHYMPIWFGDDAGTRGDMFGALNTLFSGCAFIGLIYTLFMQKEELELQRKELKQTTAELEGQKKEFEEQNKTLKLQRFENTFFNMLTLQQSITDNISFSEKLTSHGREKYGSPIEYRGRKAFEYCHGLIPESDSLQHENVRELNSFDHYFSTLYRIMKFVDTSILINEDSKYEYICILRAQLSNYELAMLFFNGLTADVKPKLKPLIEKYCLFNNLRDDILPKTYHRDMYKKNAFFRL